MIFILNGKICIKVQIKSLTNWDIFCAIERTKVWSTSIIQEFLEKHGDNKTGK